MVYMSILPMSTIKAMAPKISKAQPADASRLHSFFANHFQDNFPYFCDEARSSYSQSLSFENIEKKLTHGNEIILIAEHDETICGFLFGVQPEGGVATIIWLIVHPQYQGRKIGKQLTDASKMHYQSIGAHKIKLTVHSERALQFYLREGFSIEGKHINHWWNLDFYSVAYSINGSG